MSHVYSERVSSSGAVVPGRRRSAAWSHLTLRDGVAFAAPALIAVDFQVSGQLFLPELIALFYLPFLLADPARRRLTRGERWVIALGVAWLWSQVVTDLVRGSEFGDYSRGWSKIVFTLTSFVALALLIGDNRRRMILYASGLVAGLLIQYRYNPGVNAIEHQWKFGIGFPITLALVLVACHRTVYRVPLASPLILIAAAGVNLAKGYRSLAGICFLAGVYVLLQQRKRGRPRGARPTPAQAFALCAIAIVLILGFIRLYAYAANRGVFGQKAAQVYRQQSEGKFGVLIGGRPQTLVEAQAIVDSPLIGHGSWAKNPKYTYALLRAMQRAGYMPTAGDVYGILHSPTIPTHSYLFGAWVEAGLLGALFWIGMLILSSRVIFGLYQITDPFTPLFAFLVVDLFWAVAFSPYGAQERVLVPFILVIVMYARRRLAGSSGEAVPLTAVGQERAA